MRTQTLSRHAALLRQAALLGAAVLVCWAAPVAARQDFRASFRDGVQAFDKKRYKETVSAMGLALHDRAQEGGVEVKITGVWSQEYIPHFFAGAALYAMGDCPGALREWKESESQGFAGYGRDELDLVKQHRAACLKPLVAERTRLADAALALAEQERQALLQLEAGRDLRDAMSDPVLQKRERGAIDLLNGARERTHAAETAQDADALAKAAELSQQATGELRAVEEEATAAVRSGGKGAPVASASVAPADARGAQAAGSALKPPDTVPATTPVKAPTSTTGRTAAAGGGATEVSQHREPAAAAARAVPDALRAGMRAYFAGRYAETIATLDPARFAERPAQAEAALFVAASRMARYWLDGMRDPALLAAARGDVARCKRLDAKLTPDLRFFSPRFIEFFASSDAAAGGPSRPP
jgi:hypothetical protein